MKAITRRQTEILHFIKTFINENKFPPTVREIGGSFSISAKAAYDHIKALEKKGFLNCGSNRSRAMEVFEQPDDSREEMIKVPILGNVAAGLPLLAEENEEGSLQLPSSLLPRGRHFALHVQGDSMINAGICEGDLAIILHQPHAENGQIIVAMTDDGITLKRFYRENSRIRLQPENPAYPAIYTSDIKILGKLITIIRRYD